MPIKYEASAMSSSESLQLTQYLVKAVMQLPLAQRADLAHQILASLDESSSSGEPDEEYLAEVSAEIERRAELVARGEAKGREAADAMAFLRHSGRPIGRNA